VQRDFVSVHVKVHPGGWTEKLKAYLELMNPQKRYPFELQHYDEKGEPAAGKHLGPDGLPLLRLDGPHAAPAQHYDEYEHVMLVGAGIGLTPASAIIRSVLKYKWKKVRGRHGRRSPVRRPLWSARRSTRSCSLQR
jgi:NAD(P)H-flavin reductase